jgi:hypothetical protein
MRFIILLACTIMVAVGWTLYPGIYATWIFVVTFPKHRFIYEIFHSIGWHHYGRSRIDSLSWYIHNMDFRCDILKKTGWYMRFIILLVCTIIIAMGLTLYHDVYTTWIALWRKKNSGSRTRLLSLIWAYTHLGFCCGFAKKKGSPLIFNLFIMWYTWHGFVVPLPNKMHVYKWDLLLITAFTTWLSLCYCQSIVWHELQGQDIKLYHDMDIRCGFVKQLCLKMKNIIASL